MNETQELIDAYKRADGVMDWYKVLDLPPNAKPYEIEMAFNLLSATFNPKKNSGDREGAVRYFLLQKAFEELSDPARRKKYDAFCRFEYDHARLLIAMEAERQKQRSNSVPRGLAKIFYNVNTRNKRYALLASTFFAVIAFYQLSQDLDSYTWEPSLSFLIFALAFVICILIAFTGMGDWLGENKQ